MKPSFKPYRFEDMFDEAEEASPEQLKAVNEKLLEVGKLARKCLTNGEFQNYKQLFEDELKNIMNAMVIYTANFGKNGNDNLEIYAVNMIRFVQRITDLRKLLTYTETDARRGQELTGEDNGKN